jgi:DNA polymerase III subunit gamma/tau
MGNQALYLKWRPYAFEDMIGQGHIVETLRNSLRQGRIRHAYLFSGPRGTGKTTSARLLAKAVNCVHPDVDQRPCNECSLCIAVNEGRFLDLIEIDAASHTGVDDVRDLRDKIAFAPSEGKYKVYIIDEVHRFSGAAFDALLKTLEEPPAHAIFVLATTEIDKVPATIKSRCLMFEFRRVSVREVVERLRLIAEDEGISIDTTALELIARQGTGSVRDSISLLDQIMVDPNQHVTLEMAQYLLGAVSTRAVQEVVWAIIEGSTAAALDALNNAIDMGADPRQFGQQIVDYLRQIMLAQISGAEVVDASDEMRALYAEQASQIDRRRLLKALRNFNDAVSDLRGGWQPQLPLEIAIIESTQPVQAEEAQPARVEAAAPAPKPQPAKPAPPSSSNAPAQVSEVFVRIQRDWPDFVKNSKRYGATLPALLEWCEPYQLDGEVLTLTLRHGGLLPKIQSDHNMEPLLKALEEMAGQRLSVKITVVGESRAAGLENDDELDHYGVSHLGGEIEVLD